MDPTEDARAALGPVTCPSPTTATASACFAPTLPVFTGHFPGAPLVPGVHQLALVAELVRRAIDHGNLHLTAVLRCKWSLPVGPGEDLMVAATWRQEGAEVVVDGTVTRGGAATCTCRFSMTAT